MWTKIEKEKKRLQVGKKWQVLYYGTPYQVQARKKNIGLIMNDWKALIIGETRDSKPEK